MKVIATNGYKKPTNPDIPLDIYAINVGAAAGCDLLIRLFKSQIKRSQPAAAPTGGLIVLKKNAPNQSGRFQRMRPRFSAR
jgi:hypothetical protein